MNKRDFERGNANLMRLAKILLSVEPDARNAVGGSAYDQHHWLHTCGAPACALGYWAANNPQRWVSHKPTLCVDPSCERTGMHSHTLGSISRTVTGARMIKRLQGGRFQFYVAKDKGRRYLDPFDAARIEFCLSPREADELFNGDGCGNADDDPQAAGRYIINFVDRRRAAGGHVA